MLNTLIVEDNATYRQSLHQLLARHFPAMQVVEAPDGEEALRQAFSTRFDLIFMDVRLPRGNGLSLTRTIKTAFVDAVVCVLTSYDILEYREAAFQNGADHFMVKGESTEVEIIDLVESWLRARFITLIIVSDALYRKQLGMLLSLRWPAMVVTEAMDAATGCGHVATLKPNIVLLELDLPGSNVVELVQNIRAECAHATLIGMTNDALPAWRPTASVDGVDYRVPLTSAGHSTLASIVKAIQSEQMHFDLAGL